MDDSNNTGMPPADVPTTDPAANPVTPTPETDMPAEGDQPAE